MAIFKNPKFDFLKWRWPAVGLSLVIIASGAVAIAVQGGLALGIDFSGGTILILQFDSPVTQETLRGAIGEVVEESVVQDSGDPSDNTVMIRLPQGGAEQGTSLEDGATAVLEAVSQSSAGEFTVVRRDLVGPIIGEELKRRGVYAFVFAMLGILVYIGLRFRFSFAVGAIIAVAHDILITLALLTFFGYDLSLNVVAAMLTITGYSGERLHRGLRSSAREYAPDAARLIRHTGQHEHQPNAESHRHYFRHDGVRRPGVVSRWRRGAGGVCFHDTGWRRQRHIFDHLHRGCRSHRDQRASRCPAVSARLGRRPGDFEAQAAGEEGSHPGTRVGEPEGTRGS